MEHAGVKQESQPFSIGVFELPGEPAIIINGVPDVPQTCGTVDLLNTANDTQSHDTIGCGEWLEGREVRKLFLGQYYSGIVTKFDRESGWYRVEYEDGDAEDLDWHELEEVLLPLDVSIPLKSIALRIIRSRQQPLTLTNKYGQTQMRKTKSSSTRGKPTAAGQGSVLVQSDSDQVEKLVQSLNKNTPC